MMHEISSALIHHRDTVGKCLACAARFLRVCLIRRWALAWLACHALIVTHKSGADLGSGERYTGKNQGFDRVFRQGTVMIDHGVSIATLLSIRKDGSNKAVLVGVCTLR